MSKLTANLRNVTDFLTFLIKFQYAPVEARGGSDPGNYWLSQPGRLFRVFHRDPFPPSHPMS